MPVEEIASGLLRLLGQFFIEVFLELVCYQIGWVILRIVTLGKYPPGADQKYNEGFVIAAGFLGIFAMITLGWFIFK